MEISKEEQLKKFAYTLKKRREALGYTVRELERKSGVSKALISKIETCKINDFPKDITIKLLNEGLKFKNNELLVLANILSEKKEKEEKVKRWQENLKEFLATQTNLNSENINHSIVHIEKLCLLQELSEGEFLDKYPEIKEKIQTISG